MVILIKVCLLINFCKRLLSFGEAVSGAGMEALAVRLILGVGSLLEGGIGVDDVVVSDSGGDPVCLGAEDVGILGPLHCNS